MSFVFSLIERCPALLFRASVKFTMLFLVQGVGIEQFILNFLVEQNNKLCEASDFEQN